MTLDVGDRLEERMLRMFVTTFPSGVRDFLLVFCPPDGTAQPVNVLDLLSLDKAANVIRQIETEQAHLAWRLALCRLLVPCLHFRGSGRHLVVEPWSDADLQGETIQTDVRTDLARDLSVKQAEEFQAVTAGKKPPEGSLSELFWETQTALPCLPPTFDDPEMGRLAKALYLHLVPSGQGMEQVDTVEVAAKVEACRADDFAAFQLGISARKLQSTFKRLLAVTVRYASQLTGAVAKGLLRQRLRQRLSDSEEELFQLRYGACPALGDINLGFIVGCGTVLADLLNDYFLTLTRIGAPEDRQQAEENLRAFLWLLGQFQRRRKQARAQERRDDRLRHADRLPHGPRHQADFHADTSLPAPEVCASHNEEMALLEEMLPQLKERDAVRLRAFIDCQGDRKAAAEKLGVDHEAYSRQLRQTVFPAVQQLARDVGFNPLE